MKFLLQISCIFLVAAVAVPTYAADISDHGMTMLRMENYSGAEAYFSSALKQNPEDAAAAAGLAKVYLAQGQNKIGVTWAERSVGLAPKIAAYQTLLGDAYSMYVNDVSFFSKLSIAHKCLAAYQQAVQLDPNNPDARSELAQYYIQAPGIAGGSIDKAKEQITALNKLDPVQAALASASLSLQNKDSQQAESYLRAAAKLDKTGDSDAQLGLFLVNQGHFSKAIAAFEDGIGKDPTNSANYYYVGLAAVLSKTYVQEGIQDMQKYLTMPHDWHPNVPTYKWAHYRLGMLYGIDGNKINEKVQYEAALKLDPDFKQAKQALAEM